MMDGSLFVEAPGLGKDFATALFVYIPFCPTICTYCDFNVYARQERLFEPYADAVAREMEIVAQLVPQPRIAKSLALGGGTPSILTADQIERIVDAARKFFDFIPNAEFTLEANPGTVALEKLRALRAIGFTRVSLGVQTFDDSRLQSFNRHHTVRESYDAFETARRAGFGNVNLDLIYGLPDQTLEDWAATLDRALAFQSEHLSLYGLQVEERTVLAKQIALGRVSTPDPDTAAAMYELADEKLDAAEYRHYEISNWARPGFESRHNMTYWFNEPYLGFGAGAHSFFGGARYENVRHPREYIKRLETGDSVVAARQEISRAMEMAETVVLGLRLDQGIRFTRFRQRFGLGVGEIYGAVMAQLREWALLETDEEMMWLTPRGRLVSNQVLWRFLPDE